jgi:hypothetical protein
MTTSASRMPGKRHQDIQEPHHRDFKPPSIVPRTDAQREADRQREGHGHDPQAHRDTGAVDQPAEQIAAVLVRPKPVPRRRGLKDLGGGDLGRVVRGQQVGHKQRHPEEQEDR